MLLYRIDEGIQEESKDHSIVFRRQRAQNIAYEAGQNGSDEKVVCYVLLLLKTDECCCGMEFYYSQTETVQSKQDYFKMFFNFCMTLTFHLPVPYILQYLSTDLFTELRCPFPQRYSPAL